MTGRAISIRDGLLLWGSLPRRAISNDTSQLIGARVVGEYRLWLSYDEEGA